jgi:hypothetical protein
MLFGETVTVYTVRERERERERERSEKGGDSERLYKSGGGAETLFSI